MLQTACASHWKVQLPGPVQRFVQVLPAWQMNVHPPPLHDVSHVAPDSQVIVHPPPLHEGMHVVCALQSKVHEPLKQPGEHVPETHVHDPSVPHPVLASPLSAPASPAASALASSGAASFPESGFVETSGVASTIGDESAAAASEPASSRLIGRSSHAQIVTNAATPRITETRSNRIALSTSSARGWSCRSSRGSS